jgi:hypothetical protein
MTDDPTAQPASDPGLRRMMKWVFIMLIVVVVFAFVIVAITLRWLGT